MDTVNLKGFPVKLKDEMPAVGRKVDEVYYVTQTLDEQSVYDVDAKAKVIIMVPSLDTGVCAAETRKFNQELGKREGVTGIVVSKDLPFAAKRFCETEGIENVITGSDFRYGDFGKEFGTEMIDGALKGLLARSIVVLDSDNVIRYTQLVPEILNEPDYDEVLAEVDKLIK